MKKTDHTTEKKQRIINALWGLFIGDALAMPAHWYYQPANIPKLFGGSVKTYEAPPHPHVEAFLVGGKYLPDVAQAKKLGRKYDILFQHARFYKTSYTDFDKSGFEYDEDGNLNIKDRYHYHHGLDAGENTLNAQLVRVLMRQIVAAGKYQPDKFIADFIEYMTSQGLNNDPYTEGYLRAWFENYSTGLPPAFCASNQRSNPGLNALGGLIRPLVLALAAGDESQALAFAAQHQQLTHRSESIGAGLAVIVPAIHQIINGINPKGVIENQSAKLRLPKYEGLELFRKYQEYGGPAAVPQDVMWQLHQTFADETWDIKTFTANQSETKVVKKIFSTACYVEHGVPMLLYLAYKYNFSFEEALLANVNVGGDNVHRGMALGMLLGAASHEIPQNLIAGLKAREALEKEIEAFAEIAVGGQGLG